MRSVCVCAPAPHPPTGPHSGGTGNPRSAEGGRCGYGPRLPLLVISPWAKANHVSHSVSDQSSIVKFVEDNWDLGHIPGSFANVAGSLNDLFDFSHDGGTNP